MHTLIFLQDKKNKIIDLINDNSDIHTIMTLINKFFNFNDFLIDLKNDETIFKKFISICNIDYDLFCLLIKSIDSIKYGNYKQIYCNEYKLILILQLRNSVVKWKDLTTSVFYSPYNDSKSHYKFINNQYNRWCNNKVFYNAFINYKSLTNDCNIVNDDDDYYYVINSKSDFFIDATHINNKRGSESIIINPELKKKKVTKIVSISDINGFVCSITNCDYNKKEIMYNKKKRTIKTVQHDVNTIQQSIDNINNDIIKTKNIDLIGDKGYKTDNNFKTRNDINVKIITPNRKNQKKNLINRGQRLKLGFRYIIENTLGSIKTDERINLRKDKKINTFMGWIYISSLNHNIRVNDKILLNVSP